MVLRLGRRIVISIVIPKKEIDKIVLNNKSGDVKISDIAVNISSQKASLEMK